MFSGSPFVRCPRFQFLKYLHLEKGFGYAKEIIIHKKMNGEERNDDDDDECVGQEV